MDADALLHHDAHAADAKEGYYSGAKEGGGALKTQLQTHSHTQAAAEHSVCSAGTSAAATPTPTPRGADSARDAAHVMRQASAAQLMRQVDRPRVCPLQVR